MPFVDKMVKIDLRTVTMDVPPQDVITRDNVPARVNAVIYFRVVDPNKSVIEVENHVVATSQISQTTLRSVLGQRDLDDLLTNREEINSELQNIIDGQTDPWGIKLSVVEVKDVEIPQQMQRAMARQAESERERRAKIIAAEGEYQASQRLRQAADRLESPTALQLRLFQTMGEIAVNQNSTIILPIPLDLFRPFLESQNGTYGQGVQAARREEERGRAGGRAPVRGGRQGQPGAVRARLGRTPIQERKEGETTHGQKDNIMRARRGVRLTFVFSLAALLVACAGGGEGRPPEGSGARAVDGLRVETLAEGLDTPWELAFVPDGRILVTERPGTIRSLESGELREKPYSELPAEEAGEGGQLGLALDPAFEENGRLYAYYTTTEGDEPVNRIVRLVEEEGEVREDGVLLEAPAAPIHNGGRLAVGPDGKLYATLGDVSEDSLAQQRDALAGKIVRLELDGSVPEDNPFDDSPVYSYGHRNPQGLAWDADGNLYVPEHGPTGHDELNLVRSGENYGWPEVSGEGGEEAGFVDPVLESGQETWAPSGAAYVSEGPWDGSVLFAGLRGQALHRVTFAEEPAQIEEHEEYLKGEYGRLRTVAQGPDGALYVLTSNRDGRGSPEPQDDRLLRITVPGGNGS